jgi:hypothetical protein
LAWAPSEPDTLKAKSKQWGNTMRPWMPFQLNQFGRDTSAVASWGDRFPIFLLQRLLSASVKQAKPLIRKPLSWSHTRSTISTRQLEQLANPCDGKSTANKKRRLTWNCHEGTRVLM